MIAYTLTVIPAIEDHRLAWSIDAWCTGTDDGCTTLEEGKADSRTEAFQLGLERARARGLAIVGGDTKVGFELVEASK